MQGCDEERLFGEGSFTNGRHPGEGHEGGNADVGPIRQRALDDGCDLRCRLHALSEALQERRYLRHKAVRASFVVGRAGRLGMACDASAHRISREQGVHDRNKGQRQPIAGWLVSRGLTCRQRG